jgi:predicted DNA-binding transcriptional regulator AlpA
MNSGERQEVTSAAIARLAGVGRAAVSNWRRRYPEFPKPVGGTASSPAFDRAEVEEWLRKTGKADQLATAGQTSTGTQRIAEPEIFSPERSLADLEPGELLARVMVSILPRETALPRETTALHPETLSREAAADAPDPDDLPVLLDPACGAGAVLLAAADRFGDRIRVAGQEIDDRLAKAAVVALGENASDTPYEVHVGDSLTNDLLAAHHGKAAAVVCEPPFDSPAWPQDELATDPRWEFGTPAPRDSELAWVQHCYAHLKPRGVAVVAVTRRTCVQPSGTQIRSAMGRSGAIKAVIGLPHGMSTVPGTDVCLWVLRRPHGEADPGPIMMIDLSGLGDPLDVPREYAAWQRLFTGEDPTVCRAVSRLEILDSAANLLPSRYVRPRAEASAADLAAATQRLGDLYAAIGRGLPVFGAPRSPDRTTNVTLAELERVGALTIRPRDATPRQGDVLLRTLGRPPVVATGTSTDDAGVAQVVEIDEKRLDAHFVAVFLRADVAALPVANTLGAVNREDLRRCRVPRLPLADQRQFGDAFRQLLDLQAALSQLANVGGKVLDQVIHGLTTGVISPDHGTTERSS